MRMYVKVMAAVIACILLSGEAYSALATTCYRKSELVQKEKEKKFRRRESKKRLREISGRQQC